MISQYPQPFVPEPYLSYINERNKNIACALEPIVKEQNVQLCPRAIDKTEQMFKKGIIYGVVVSQPQDGLKSVLYEDSKKGISAQI